jgi:hypothetical protein
MRYQFWTALSLAIAATITPAISPAVAELPPLIPRDVLLGNPERSQPETSPDGKYLAYRAPDAKNILQVWMNKIQVNLPSSIRWATLTRMPSF